MDLAGMYLEHMLFIMLRKQVSFTRRPLGTSVSPSQSTTSESVTWSVDRDTVVNVLDDILPLDKTTDKNILYCGKQGNTMAAIDACWISKGPNMTAVLFQATMSNYHRMSWDQWKMISDHIKTHFDATITEIVWVGVPGRGVRSLQTLRNIPTDKKNCVPKSAADFVAKYNQVPQSVIWLPHGRQICVTHSKQLFVLDSVDKFSLSANIDVARDAVRNAISLELPTVQWDEKIFDEWFENLPSEGPLRF
jgi:hypothetical protein